MFWSSQFGLLAERGVHVLSCWRPFLVTCCEVAAHLSVGLKDPKILSGEGKSWYPRVLADNVSGITDVVTALPSSC